MNSGGGNAIVMLFGEIVLLGAVTLFVARKVNGTLLSGVSLFWVSWIVLVMAAWVAQDCGLIPEISDSSFQYVREALVGAFGGGLVGIFLAGRVARRRGSPIWLQFARTSEWAADRLTGPIALVAVILGCITFWTRWAAVEFDPFRLLDVRIAYLSQGTLPWFARLSNYIMLLSAFIIILQGAADAEYGVRWRRLAVIWASAAPGGLSAAGRGWTLVPFLIYGFSYAVSSNVASSPLRWRRLMPVAGLVMGGLWLFTVIGTVRNLGLTRADTDKLSIGAWDDGQKLMTLQWIGSSLFAVGVHSEFAETLAPAYGEATFGYFTTKANDAGLLPGSRLARWERWTKDVLPLQGVAGEAWCMPPTAIPYLVLDYGRALMPWVFGLFVAAAHWLSLRWVGQGLFRHVVSFLAFMFMLNTIQQLTIFTSMNVVVAFWAALTAAVLRRLSRRRVMYRAGAVRTAT